MTKKDELIDLLVHVVETYDDTDSVNYQVKIRFLPVIVEFVAQWLDDWMGGDENSLLSLEWREDMT